MKTIAVDEEVYKMILSLRTHLSKSLKSSISFSDVLSQMIKRSYGLRLLNEDIQKLLDLVTQKLSSCNDILGIVLFGSVAKEIYDRNSDIDLFIVV